MESNEIFENLQEGIFSVMGGKPETKTIVIGVVVALVILGVLILLGYLVYKMFFSGGFGNGRVVGSGCGRYNQLQRAINLDLPLAQTEYENAEMAKQSHAGIRYASQWQPAMENVYSGFSDRQTSAEIENYQVVPQYPQTGFQSVYNDNVFKNIAYTD